MPVPVARTLLESSIYLELHPCACGETGFEWTRAEPVDTGDGVRAHRRVGYCRGCRHPREWVFALPEPARPGGDAWETFFGGDEPSQIIDAGEWLEIAHGLARTVPSEPDPDPAARVRHREALTAAVAAVTEVLKFIAPGRDEPADDAFWTQRGWAKRTEQRVQFERARLLAYRSGLLRVLRRMGGSWFDGRPVAGWLR